MSVGDIDLRKFNILRLYLAVRRPFLSRREHQWLTIKNRPITVFAKDDILREGDIAQRDPGIAHAVCSFRNLVGVFSIILYTAFRNRSLRICERLQSITIPSTAERGPDAALLGTVDLLFIHSPEGRSP